MVTPSFFSSSTTRHISLRNSTSTPADGSSRKSNLGSWLSALAMRTRRFIPPDSVIFRLSRLSHKERRFKIASMRPSSGARPNSPREKRTVPLTFSKGSIMISCGTSEIWRLAASGSLCTSWPPTVIEPDVTLVRPHTAEISVVLPAPLGPSNARISPSLTSKLTDFRA